MEDINISFTSSQCVGFRTSCYSMFEFTPSKLETEEEWDVFAEQTINMIAYLSGGVVSEPIKVKCY